MSPTRFALALLAAGTFAVPAGARLAAPAGPAFLVSCAVEDLEGETYCGKFPVWENRAASSGRRLELNVLVLPALGEETLPDPLVFLAGGPGDASTEAAGGLALFMKPLRERRDILLVDQRGTGESAALRCAYQEEPGREREYLSDMWPPEGVRRCRDELSASADLTQYTTPIAADDLDEARAALGYPQLNLLGVSYGTRAAMVYAARHPRHVRTLTLLGAVPTDAKMPFELAEATEAALDGLFADCAAEPACHAAFPDPSGDLAGVLARLEGGPVEVAIEKGGEEIPMRLNRAAFVQTLRYMLYDASLPPRVPLVVSRAAAGDFAPVAELAYEWSRNLSHMPEGIYLSITCAEDVPFFDLEEARRRAAGTMIGALRADLQKAACELWPRASLPADYFVPFASEAPTLLLVGQLDPASPPHWSRRIAGGLANALLIEVPHGAHDFTGLPGGECLDPSILRFIEQGSLAGLDASCVSGAHRPPFVTELVVEQAIELPAEALAAFAGTYGDDGGLTLVVELVEGHLEGIAGGERLTLTAVGPTRFRVEEAPPGTAIEFDREGERVMGLRLYRGTAEPIALVRR